MYIFVRLLPRYMAISVVIVTCLSSYFLILCISYVWLHNKPPQNLVNKHNHFTTQDSGSQSFRQYLVGTIPHDDNGLEDSRWLHSHVWGLGNGRRGKITLPRDGTRNAWFHLIYFIILVRGNIINFLKWSFTWQS